MGRPGERSPRSGFEGAGAPRQPQCITLGRLAPRHYAVRRRPRCPRLARRAAREGCSWRDGWPRPNCDHAPVAHGRAVHCRSRPFRFPHRGGPAVPEREIGPGRVPGCSAMPGAWKSQPAPGKAQGFRGRDTVERRGGLHVVMEKIDSWEQEHPASNGREMIDDFRCFRRF